MAAQQLCSACGKQNREQARFCGHCGHPLQTTTLKTGKSASPKILTGGIICVLLGLLIYLWAGEHSPYTFPPIQRDLTRQKAAALIAQKMEEFSPAKPELMFNKDLIGDRDARLKGIREGLWYWRKPKRGPFLELTLTPKGKEFFEEVEGALVTLAKPYMPRVIEITGIADAPFVTGVKEVAFTWEWQGVPDLVRAYCNVSPLEGNALIRLYDDGWRIENLNWR